MFTLAIDTSTPHGSVALLGPDGILLHENFTADRSHSSTLFAVLERVCATAPKLDRIAIGLGPGSYAGVRIAIAASLGLSLTKGAELVGIPSVAVLDNEAGHYIAAGDARRETFYWTEVRDGLCVRGPELVEAAEFQQRLAATSLPVLVTEALGAAPNAQVALPDAVRLARLAAADAGIVQRHDLEPIYLRDPHITVSKRAPIVLPPLA